MAWIESHQALANHPKVLDLMDKMDWDLDTALGKLHRFWWWCVDYAEDGDLRKHNDNRIGRAVGMNSSQDCSRFVRAMVESCWIDRVPYFRVHDWWDYIGLFLQRKYGEKNKGKWERVKLLYTGSTEVVQRLSQPTNQPNQPTNPPAGAHVGGIPPTSTEARAHGEAATKPKPFTGDSPLVREIFDAYPNTRETGDSTMKGIGHLDAIARVLNAKPDYPMLQVVQRYAATTKRPWNLDRFLQELPDPKSFLKKNPEPVGSISDQAL